MERCRMGFPKIINKFNVLMSRISGAIIMLIGVFGVYEVIARQVFNSPTKWSADFSQYLLIWAIFLASGYAFQEKGHVRVDLFTGKMPLKVRRVAAFVAYACAMVFVIVLTKASWDMFVNAAKMNAKTYAIITIPKTVLLLAMIVGCVDMIVTLISIFLDLAGKNE
jgi:TRAP-type C4-dicarboxylate transport system permease small subunit